MIFAIVVFSLALVWGGGALFVLSSMHPGLFWLWVIATGAGSMFMGTLMAAAFRNNEQR